MKADWIMASLICFTTMSGRWMLLVPAADVQHVHLGSTITLGCNISYLYDTTWFKQNPDLVPTLVLRASLREGQAFESFRLSPRHSASVMKRSLALRITAVEAVDLGLYYCIANMNGRVVIGRGTRIHLPDSSPFLFLHWYSAAVASGLLILIMTVCVTHWKTRKRK